jgi:hypothetical protein
MSDTQSENPQLLPRGRPWVKGQSGNPAGRKPGCRNKATRAAEIYLDGEAEALIRLAVEQAFAGDSTALKLCLARTVAPRRERPVAIQLPPIRSAADIAPAIDAIATALTKGTITTGQAAELAQMLDTFVRAVDAVEFERRLTLLEKRHVRRR